MAEPTAPRYEPRFHMPIIDASDAGNGYANVGTVTVTQVGSYALQVDVANPAYNQLYAMAGTVVYFVPGGSTPPLEFKLHDLFPDLPQPAAGNGFLALKTWPVDVHSQKTILPAGIQPLRFVAYINVEPTSVRAALKPFVEILPDELLEDSWDQPAAGSRDDYIENLLDLVMATKRGIFVAGGTPVGRAALQNSGVPASTRVTLFSWVEPTVDQPESLIPHLRELPEYGGQEWTGHPLIEAISELPVPFDAHLFIDVWDPASGSFQPLPAGVPVELKDDDFLPPDDSIVTIPSGADGRVHIRTTLGPEIEDPDLYFLVDLPSNPEPTILDDPWPSHTGPFVGPHAGYYPDFRGSRVGSYLSPLLFHIGLGFWSDLLAFQVSGTIIRNLALANRSVQAIADAYHEVRDNPPGQPFTYYTPISFDYYPVIIQQLPNNTTAEQLLKKIRVDINDFIDTNYGEFFPTDETGWNSDDPLGVVVRIDLNIDFLRGTTAERGDVVVGESATNRFKFVTIFDPDDHGHPLGGVREFGFRYEVDSTLVFYTRGADRAWNHFDDLTRDVIFSGADGLWSSFQEKLAAYVNDPVNGGEATIGNKFSQRFDWEKAKDLYGPP